MSQGEVRRDRNDCITEPRGAIRTTTRKVFVEMEVRYIDAIHSWNIMKSGLQFAFTREIRNSISVLRERPENVKRGYWRAGHPRPIPIRLPLPSTAG